MYKLIIAFPHRAIGQGGPSSFQERLVFELEKKSFRIVYPNDKITPDIIIINGGTKKLLWLLIMKLRGAKIIHRMDGIGWIHKFQNLSKYSLLRAELRNLQMKLIRNILADYVIYQSNFVEKWVNKKFGKINIKSSIIYNGVNLDVFKPRVEILKKKRIISVEGYLDYSPFVTNLLNEIFDKIKSNDCFSNIQLYGLFFWKSNKIGLNQEIKHNGYVSREKINLVYNDAIFLSLDINPACPNTVIEALASGIPVIGFDTGALKELVPPEAGEIVPYGGNPWKLDFPNVDNLVQAAEKVLSDWKNYSKNARKIAEMRYSVKNMTDNYILAIKKIL